MASLTPDEAIRQLRRLYRDAHHLHSSPVDDVRVIAWASANNLHSWATIQVRHRGWTFQAVELTVRKARQLLRRAIKATPACQVPPEPAITTKGEDPYDSLLPVEP